MNRSRILYMMFAIAGLTGGPLAIDTLQHDYVVAGDIPWRGPTAASLGVALGAAAAAVVASSYTQLGRAFQTRIFFLAALTFSLLFGLATRTAITRVVEVRTFEGPHVVRRLAPFPIRYFDALKSQPRASITPYGVSVDAWISWHDLDTLKRARAAAAPQLCFYGIEERAGSLVRLKLPKGVYISHDRPDAVHAC